MTQRVPVVLRGRDTPGNNNNNNNTEHRRGKGGEQEARRGRCHVNTLTSTLNGCSSPPAAHKIHSSSCKHVVPMQQQPRRHLLLRAANRTIVEVEVGRGRKNNPAAAAGAAAEVRPSTRVSRVSTARCAVRCGAVRSEADAKILRRRAATSSPPLLPGVSLLGGGLEEAAVRRQLVDRALARSSALGRRRRRRRRPRGRVSPPDPRLSCCQRPVSRSSSSSSSSTSPEGWTRCWSGGKVRRDRPLFQANASCSFSAPRGIAPPFSTCPVLRPGRMRRLALAPPPPLLSATGSAPIKTVSAVPTTEHALATQLESTGLLSTS